jgi:DNA-binding NarL/FixJ family response regulator
MTLTKREIEIMELLSEGFPSKKIAEKIYVSKRTVDFHLANIFSKLELPVGERANRTLALKRYREVVQA